MLKKIVVLILIASFCISCTIHRTPYTINAFQPDDRQRDCESLKNEVSYYYKKIDNKIKEVNARTGKNIAFGISGAILILPWFFMDTSKAETTELESYKMRIEHLQLVALDKECTFTTIKFINYMDYSDSESLRKSRWQYIMENMDKPVSKEDLEIILNSK